MNNMNTKQPNLKNESQDIPAKKPRLHTKNANGPRIPANRSTLTSKSNSSSPIIPKPKRFSNASTSSVASTGSTTSTPIKKQRLSGPPLNNSKITKRSSNSLVKSASPQPTGSGSTNPRKRPVTAATSSAINNPRSPNTTAKGSSNRLSNASTSSLSTATRPIKRPVGRTTAPAWDTKGQLKELLAQNAEIDEQVLEAEKEKEQIQVEVDASNEKLKEAEKVVTDLEVAIKELNDKNAQQTQDLQGDITLKNKEVEDQIHDLRSKIEALEKEQKEIEQASLDTLKSIESEKLENVTLNNRKSDIEASYTEADSLLFSRKTEKKNNESTLNETELQLFDLAKDLQEKEQLIKDLNKTLFEMEMQRRKDHEKLQELKGNIRVFCRVRPSLDPLNDENLVDVKYSGEENENIELSEQVTSARGIVTTKSYQFTFDKVFSPDSNQSDCYEEISQLVQSALDGFNVCIFAYGQTGSGKTFTMQGPPKPDEETIGMIPRAVKQIYEVAQKLKEYDWEYTMEGQFLEIYNDSINDLLGNPSTYGKIKHDIYHTDEGTTVTKMTTVVLDSPSKVETMLKKATQNRATGATNINERSSRSHSVFTLRLTGYNKETQEHSYGRLNLIDLAGSERLSQSGSTGDRLTETISINKSLSCLQSVIHALVTNKKGGYVRYRDSKLTYLLQNSLGRNCKTLMFVNVSPLKEHFNESICSLRFAKEANSCHVGPAKAMSTK